MGLDASVLCDCLRMGLVRTPPFPLDLVVLDEDGWPGLDLPDGGTDEEYHRFREWLGDCCEHPRMTVVNVRIANWGGLRSFEAALDRVGRERFPCLFAEVPHSNGGHTDPPAAARVLAELATFRTQAEVGVNARLLDSATGHILADHDATWAGNLFVLGGGSGYDVGLDARGLFIVSRTEPRREVFRAMRVQQEHHPTDAAVELVNVDTGDRFRHRLGAGDQPLVGAVVEGRLTPRSMHVEAKPRTPADYEYIVASLEAVFTASVETGNPVRWH
jgi:hypothetical protein